jgi:hypothetical protein
MCEQIIGVHRSHKCSCKGSRMNSSLDTYIKLSYSYSTKRYFICLFVTSVINILLFVGKLIFSCKCDLRLKSSCKQHSQMMFFLVVIEDHCVQS